MSTRRRLACHYLASFVAAAALPAARAQSRQAVRVLVPYSPGSITDVIARVAAQGLSERLQQPVVVETRSGAGGIIALKALQAAKPDGLTLGLIPSGSVVQPWLMKEMPFDVRKDFTPLSLLFAGPLMLVVPPELPVNDMEGFLAYTKANPTRIFYGSSGVGTATQLAAELLKQAAGIEMTHVPFRGSAEAYTAIGAGQVNAYFDLYGTARPMLDAGRVKVLGVTSARRISALPKVPAIVELVPGYEVLGWTGFAAPPGMPADVSQRLARHLQATLQEESFRKRLAEMGVEPGGNTPAEFAAFISSEYDKWGAVTRRAGMKPE